MKLSLSKSVGIIFLFISLVCFSQTKSTIVLAQTKTKSKKKLSTAAEKNKKLKGDFKTSFSLNYDDNIIQLSARDLAIFDSGDAQYSTHFEIESTNDFILNPGIAYKINKNNNNLTFSYKSSFYTKNNIKNYTTFSISYIKNLNKKTSLGFKYLFIPTFYLRNLSDVDDKDANGTLIYHPAKMKINSLALSLEKELKNKTNFNLTLQYALKDYNQNFNERDLNSLGGELSLEKYFSKILKGNFDISFTNNKAKAKGENPNIIYADVSNQEWTLKTGIAGGEKQQLLWKISYEYANKKFTTNLTTAQDPFHSGRKDKTNEFKISLIKKLTNSLQTNLTYTNTKKTSSDISASTSIDETTSFKQNEVSLGLIYNIK